MHASTSKPTWTSATQPNSRGTTNATFSQEGEGARPARLPAAASGAELADRRAAAQSDGIVALGFDNDYGAAAAGEASNRRATARLRRMSRKFVGTLRRNQYEREQALLRQLDGAVEAPTGPVIVDAPDGDPFRNPAELKSMTTLSLHQKRSILHRMKDKFANEGIRSAETLRRLRSGLDARVRLARGQISGAIYTLGFWRGHLKALQGHFGTDVTAYFVFLRWLFLANFSIGIVIMLFLFVPQLVHRFQEGESSRYHERNFTAMDLLTGKGWFENTEMYYGFYSNSSLSLSRVSSSLPELPYNVRLAYLLTIGCYIAVFFVTMAVSTARSYRTNFIEGSSEFRFYYVAKVLIGWDCGILDSSTAKERKKSLLRELQEYVSSLATSGEAKKCSDVAATVMRHLVAVIVQLGIIGGTGYELYYLVVEKCIVSLAEDSYRDLTISLLVTGLNGILPFFFLLASWLQRFEKEMYSILSTLIMTCLLYGSTLGSLLYALLGPQAGSPGSNTTCTNNATCWETAVGYQLYQLALFDLLFAIVMMLLIEGMHRVISKLCSKRISAPQFDIARNTQNLMYSQVLCWLGIYYCPMITVVTVVKLFILFYLKRYFIKVTCVPNTKHWKGAQMQTWFLMILFIFFICSCAVFGVNISMLRPSKECGPFTGLPTPVDLILHDNDTAVSIIVSPGTMVVVIVTLSVAAHYTRVVSNGKRELVRLLREQIVLECKDKVFLQKLLEQIQKAKMNRKTTKRVVVSTIGTTASHDEGAEGNERDAANQPATDDTSSPPANQLQREMQQTPYYTTRSSDMPESSGARRIFARVRNARTLASEDTGYYYGNAGQ